MCAELICSIHIFSSLSSSQVFLLLVKRLASLHCSSNNLQQNINNNNNLKSLQKQQSKEIRNCRIERDKNSDESKSNGLDEQNNDKRDKLTSDDHYINDKISKSTRTEKIMGSNVSSGKAGLSGRRTQSQSEYIHLFVIFN